ncbi:hypothetical protein CGLO_00877 [Colletotrichum gloeosporioides Cg-14]|uniref:Uncharacterized protein n=1 Tax=Colletotrichum gloeosporioides (strain Cg-14) TaxID=1237896 RepID=T0MCP8_COLGC|nr:hypothetical protein CGLO_00877 [Colletotrichum gloeosporioides Cg-14]
MSLGPLQSDPSFAQQGSVDWVALSNTSVQTSMAVLARLSRAGLEPLTAVVCQGIFSLIPIGIEGEKAIHDALSKSKAYSTFGDVLWFGIGVRHILRELPKTSEGASSVAIAAALAEGFSVDFGAAVLFELAKLTGSPAELTPSFSQWQVYSEICSSILTATGFGVRVNQLTKVLGFAKGFGPRDRWPVGREFEDEANDARKIAGFLLTIGSIIRGEIQAVEVSGGFSCLWAYVLCDMIFGIRAEIFDRQHEGLRIIAQNYDQGKNSYQVRFMIDGPGSFKGMLQTKSIYSLQYGVPAKHLNGRDIGCKLRVPENEILAGLFGDEIIGVLQKDTHLLAEVLDRYVLLKHYTSSPRLSEYLSKHDSPQDLLDCLITAMPELGFSSNLAAEVIDREQERYQSPHASRGAYPSSGIHEALHDIPIEIKRIWLASIRLAYALSNVILDEPLHPTRIGLRRFFQNRDRDFRYLITGYTRTATETEQYIDPEWTVVDYIGLFSGWMSEETWKVPSKEKKILSGTFQNLATSREGIYCYYQYLADPFQSYQDAKKVHIGRGTVLVGRRHHIYREIWSPDRSDMMPFYDNLFCGIPVATSARLMVDESISGLKVWYEQWGETHIEHVEASHTDEVDSRQAVSLGEALENGWLGFKGAWRGPYGTIGDSVSSLKDEKLEKWKSVYLTP